MDATTNPFKWIVTGSEDGTVRCWDVMGSLKGRAPLLVGQRATQNDTVVNVGDAIGKCFYLLFKR